MKKIYIPLVILLMPIFLSSQIRFAEKKTGLGVVTDITHAGDGSKRIFVASKNGIITILDSNFNNLGTLLLIVPQNTDERGLLGLAFHPDFKNNGHFFVNYTPFLSRTTRISRFTVAFPGANLPATLLSEKIILDITNASSDNHKAGDLAFGPDGYLYITTGDGGGGYDPQNSGQTTNSLLGKILRIDVNVPDPMKYTIPSNNPFVGNAAYRPEIWDLGLRNPWRISFDKVTGDLWIADVGQNAREEINLEPANQGGKNYGWRCREGLIATGISCPGFTGYTDPIFDYGHCSGACLTPGLGNSITGGFVYRGSRSGNAALKGWYVFSDYVSKHAWVLKQTVGPEGFRRAIDVRTIANFTPNGIITFGETETGEMLAAQSNGSIGFIEATAALPIRLSSFTGELSDRHIDLAWSTSYESNTNLYEIEKSVNGKSFESIGSIYAKNLIGGSTYNFKDLNPFPGINYYRIKSIDLDGSFDYTEIIKIKFNQDGLVYFNKSKNSIELKGDWAFTSDKLELFSVHGQRIGEYVINDNSIQLSTTLVAGIYFIKSEQGGVHSTRKIFIY